MKAIVLEVQPLSPVLTMAEALAPGAPLVHENRRDYDVLTEGAARSDNVACEARTSRGDVEAAFARDDVRVIESRFAVGRRSHVPFEPRVAIGAWEDGRAHIQTSTQVPWTVRGVTGRALGLAPGRVRVTVPPVGGGFGLKFDATIEPITALREDQRARRRPGEFAAGGDGDLPVPRKRRDRDPLGGDAGRRDRRSRGRGADGLRRLWRRTGVPDHDDGPHATKGRVEIGGRPGSGTTIAAVVQHAHWTTGPISGPISGSGAFTAAGTPAQSGCAMGHIDALDIPVFVVHEAEVEVDPDTGHVEVLAYRVVQDVGRALNPCAILGQIQGGVVQGLG